MRKQIERQKRSFVGQIARSKTNTLVQIKAGIWIAECKKACGKWRREQKTTG